MLSFLDWKSFFLGLIFAMFVWPILSAQLHARKPMAKA